MFKGISAIVKHYRNELFSGSLRFSISETNGVTNIDLCEDTTVSCSSNALSMDRLEEICGRIRFGWILVYLEHGNAKGFDYKINFQGMTYKKFEKECISQCSTVKVVVKKSNT